MSGYYSSLTSRACFGMLFVFCLFLLATSLILEYGFSLPPCLLCLVDRVLVIFLCVLYGGALLQKPKKWGAVIYSLIGLLVAAIGITATLRHLWLQNAPQNSLEGCSPGLEYLLQTLPLKDALRTALQSSPECTTHTGYFLGLSIPAWTMLGFTLIALGNLMAWRVSMRKQA